MLLTIWSGLILGSIYALVAIGLTVSMLPSGIFNFAQGAIVLVGTYLTYTFTATHHLNLPGRLALTAAVGFGLGALCELACIRPLRRGHHIAVHHNELITTVGLSTAIVGAIGVIWGYQVKAIPFDGPSASTRFFGINAQPVQYILLAATITASITLHLWVRHTRYGRMCLAVAEDSEAASLRGINVDALSLAGFAAAGAFGTLTAILIGPISYAVPTLANILSLGGFAAIALGGRANLLGSLLGGLLVGVVSSLASRYLGGYYASLAVLALLVLTVCARPSGLTARSATRNV